MIFEDVAIIIPTYKPGSYVEDCLTSINNQTIDKALLRVLLVLNGPKEPYYSKLCELKNKYSRFNISLLYNEECGVSKARNIGIERALSSKYFIFIDDDDYLSPSYVNDLYNTIEIRNSDVVQSNFKQRKAGYVTDDYISKAYKKQFNKRFSFITHRSFFSSVCGKIFKNSTLGNIRFREDITMGEDSIFMFAISKNVKKFCLAGEKCVYYRNVRLGSASLSKRGLLKIFQDYKLNFLAFSNIYFREPINYNFLFYMSRLMAITKYLKTELKFYYRTK
jgi:glycosyltransferase involved in cell wall biosynthesis